MQIGMIGLGRMGSNMARRLMGGGHECVVHDTHPEAVRALRELGARGAVSRDSLISQLTPPRAIWLMLPAALVDQELTELALLLEKGDIIIDGGNSYYLDDIRRSKELKAQGIHYVDVGTSGGVAGFERGYCLMIGGEKDVVQHLVSIFATLAPGLAAAPRTAGVHEGISSAEQGFLHCGPSGAGHFVKMVHNGIEYGLMQAYAEGLNILSKAGAGKEVGTADAETTPMRNPEAYQYDFDLSAITEVWRRGSVISSWILDLTAHALLKDPQLKDFGGNVADSGEGRWTLQAAIDLAAPAPVLSAALYERFSSRGEAGFANKVLSAMRQEFGGHVEKSAPSAAPDAK